MTTNPTRFVAAGFSLRRTQRRNLKVAPTNHA